MGAKKVTAEDGPNGLLKALEGELMTPKKDEAKALFSRA